MSQDSYTSGFVIQTEMGVHVGFVLASPNFRVERGDCVFMLMAEKPQVLDTYVGRALIAAKESGEHQWSVVDGAIEIRANGLHRISITSGGKVVLPNGSVIGKAVPLPARQ